MHRNDYPPRYGDELWQHTMLFAGSLVAPFQHRKLKSIAGPTRYERWQATFGFGSGSGSDTELFIVFRYRPVLAAHFRNGPEEFRAAAFEMLYLQSQNSQKKKLLQEAFESDSRYLRERAAGVCVWHALIGDSYHAISHLASFVPAVDGVERIVLLLHLNALRDKYQAHNDPLFAVDMTPEQRTLIDKIAVGWCRMDWVAVVNLEYEYIFGHLILYDTELILRAGFIRFLGWCKHFSESCIIAIKHQSYAEDLVKLSHGRAWIAAVEMLVLSHHRDDPIPILRQLLGPNPDINVCTTAGEIVASIYENTSNPDALSFVDRLTGWFPPLPTGFCFFSFSRAKIMGET